MVANLGLLPLTEIQKLAESHSQQQQLNPNSQQLQQRQQNPNSSTISWMLNPNQGGHKDVDSWEIRAFEEDTSNSMGSTWPPRSYTCTFCRREFRSAQALGGHMNVHRRDRARLNQTGVNHPTTTAMATSTSTLLTNGGLCLLYSLPNPNGTFSPKTFRDSPSAIHSTSPYQKKKNNLNSSFSQPIHFPVGSRSLNTSPCHSRNTGPSDIDSSESRKDIDIQELDLELRLGRGVNN